MAGTDASRARILFVEDEASISEPFSHALERAGFEPVVGAHGRPRRSSSPRAWSPTSCCSTSTSRTSTAATSAASCGAAPTVPIVMLTARGTETDRIVGLELGADDYVVKPFSGREVVSRIRAVLRRTRRPRPGSIAPSRVTIGDLGIDPGARRAGLDGEELELTRKEFDLLAELVRDAGRVVTREDLMSGVWDENWFGSTKTLDVHIGWLRRKLGDDPAAAALHPYGARRRVPLPRAGGTARDGGRRP